MAEAVPYIAAAGTFVLTGGNFQAAQAAFVVSSAVMGLINKPKTSAQASQERQASAISLSFGEVPREVLLGHTITGGSLVDGFNHGGQYGTDYVTLCIALADHPTGDPLAYWVGENRFLFTGNGNQGSHGAALSMEFRQATQSGHIPPAIALGNGWTADDRLCSISHIWVTYKTDEKVWTQGHPQFRFELNGLRVYDPRRDVRFGYTGPSPQTWEDTSTHLHTQNAALLRYALARGVYAEGHQGDPAYLLVGRGLSEEEAPPLYTISAANLCDEKVDGEDRYLAQGTIRASDTFIAVEELFATAMGGTIIQRGGAVEVEPGQPKAAVATITDLDLVAGAPVSYSGFLPDTDGGRANSVLPRYISPLHRWQDHAGPVRRDVADIISDGGPREITLSMPLVAWEGQAGRVAEMTRRLSRLERRMTLVLPPDYAWIEEGDWLAVQSDRRHGGATRRYRVEAWTLDRAWRMQVTLREISATVYGGVDVIIDEADSPPPPIVLDALALSMPAVEAAALEGPTGSAVPGITFSWAVPVDRAVREIRAEIRPVSAPGEIASTTTADVGADLAPGRKTWVVTNGVRPDTELEARLVPIGENGRPIVATAWTPVTATGLTAGGLADGSAAWDAIRQAAADAAGEAEERLNNAIGEAEDRLQSTISTLGLGDLTDFAAYNLAINMSLGDKVDITTFNGIAGPQGSLTGRVGTIEQFVQDSPNNFVGVTRMETLEARARVAAADASFRLDSTASAFTEGDGTPEASPVVNPGRVVQSGPLYAYSNPGAQTSFLTRKWVPHQPGIVLELEIEIETVANPNNQPIDGLALGVRYYNAAGVGQGQSNFIFTAPAVGQKTRFKRRFASPAPAGGSALTSWDFYRGRFLTNRNANGTSATGADVRVTGFSINDVTAQVTAEASLLTFQSATADQFTAITNSLTIQSSAIDGLGAAFTDFVTTTGDALNGKADALRVTRLEAKSGGANLLGKSQWFPGDPVTSPAWPVNDGSMSGAVGGIWENGAWSPDGEAIYHVVQPPTPLDGVYRWYDLVSDFIPWEGDKGKTYSASVYSGAHRCTVQIFVEHLDVNKNLIGYGEDIPRTLNQNEKQGGKALGDFKRIGLNHTPPGNTRYLRVYLRKTSTTSFPGEHSFGFFLRPMLAEAVEGSTDLVPWSPASVEAQSSVQQQATADLYGRTMGRWAVDTNVPGAGAFIFAQAEQTPGAQPTSDVGIGARRISLFSQTAQGWVPAMAVQNGNAIFYGGLQAGAFIRLGNGQGWPVALRSVDFNASDGEVVSFGTDLGSIPSLNFAMNNLAVANTGAGEAYDVRAVNLTPTGFTLYAKIIVPGTPTAFDRTNVVATTAFGSGGSRIDKSGDANSSDGTYRLTGSGSNRHEFEGKGFDSVVGIDDMDYVTGEVQVWVRRAGQSTWQMAATIYTQSAIDRRGWPQGQYVTASGTFSFDETLNLGDNVAEVGTRHAQHGQAAEYQAGLARLRWTAPGTSSGTRSATPNGQTTRITVRPN